MSEEPTFRTVYVPLPADLWAQAAYLTMRPAIVREQASAMLVRVVQAIGELAQGADEDAESFDALPADTQARILGQVRNVLIRFAAPSH